MHWKCSPCKQTTLKKRLTCWKILYRAHGSHNIKMFSGEGFLTLFYYTKRWTQMLNQQQRDDDGSCGLAHVDAAGYWWGVRKTEVEIEKHRDERIQMDAGSMWVWDSETGARRERWLLTHPLTEQTISDSFSSPRSAAGSLSSKLFPVLVKQISPAEPA